MTVQTLWGYVQMYVYETGRDLLETRRRARSTTCCPRRHDEALRGRWRTPTIATR